MSAFETLAIRNPFIEDDEAFAALAARCVRAGVTHLTFTELDRSYWEIEDPLDPYPHWSVVHTSLLKLFPPKILEDWVPAGYVVRQRERLAARAAILKKAGLKGAAFLYDPMYWPERVFRERPDLRGPRVDHPERCRHPCYAPCIDHPEVLAFYRDAFRGLCELSGGVLDLVIIRTNDSATGFCWSRLYNGMNGPEACRQIAPRERITRFLSVGLEGMAAAGGDGARIYLGGGAIGGDDPEAFAAALPARCGYYAHGRANRGGDRILSGFQSKCSLYPIRGLPNPVETLDQLAHSHENGWPHLVLFTCPAQYGNDWEGDEATLRMIEAFQREPCRGMTALASLTRKTAETIYGPENAEDAANAWWNLFLASEDLRKSDVGTAGFYIFLTCLAQRWLTRPLVVFPERLTEEEKVHYKPWLFQANRAHEALDVLDLEPARLVDGRGSLEYFNRLMEQAVHRIRRARRDWRAIHARGGRGAERAARPLRALEILLCFLKTVSNFTNFQIKLEALRARQAHARQDPAREHTPGALVRASSEARARRAELNLLLRSEIDNACRLAGLVEEDPAGLMETAPSRDSETPFLLGADLPAALRRKAAIMQDHLLETDELIGLRE